MRGVAFIILGAIAGFLPAAAFPMWPASLPGTDYVRGYSLWTALRWIEIQPDLFISAVIAASAATIGGFCGWRIEHAIIDRQTARRLSQGCCPECGYDLRGNTTGICPECGAAAKRPRWKTIQKRIAAADETLRFAKGAKAAS